MIESLADWKATAYALANTIRERDVVTYDHCRRVAVYVRRLARGMGWSQRAAKRLALSGLVHDLGKTWIQNMTLHKDSTLSNDERAEMERHSKIGARMLEAYGAPEMAVQAVLHHHETYDGRGYPDHLAGEDIPMSARLLSVADVFDVITSERPYKAALDITAARARLIAGTGTSFDPAVVERFVSLLDQTPNFLIPARISPLPSRQPASSAWHQHDMLAE